LVLCFERREWTSTRHLGKLLKLEILEGWPHRVNDPFTFIMIGTTYTGCLLFNHHFLYRRQSRRGQSRLLVWTLAFTPCFYWFFCLPSIGPAMNNAGTYAFGLAQLMLGLGYAVYYQTSQP